MNSFMKTIKTAPSGDDKTNADQPSNTNLMSSAKLVAEAAQSAANNQTDQIDKPKVAGAAGDLDSVKEYGNFDESQGVGQYIKQADDYLHQYEKSGVTATSPAEVPPAPEEKKAEVPVPVEEEKVEVPVPVEEKGGKEESESGIGAGDALKAAGSFLK